MERLKELLFRLCTAHGTSGDEGSVVRAAEQELEKHGEIKRLPLGSVICTMGNWDSSRRILLDAHIDQIGMIVTSVDKEGFLRIAPCGGMDRRVLPGTPVLVYGREKITGIVCCLPPHLVEGGEDKVEPVDKMAVDIGMDREHAEKIVAPGDRILLYGQPRSLLEDRVTCLGLDNRAGVAALIRCAQLIQGESLNCAVAILLSSREEVGGQGAETAAFDLEPTEALIVDVSFAAQPGVPQQKCGKMEGGPMVGIAPVLARPMWEKLIRLAEEKKIPYQREIMGGTTGTNTDGIIVSRGGVPCAMASVPLRYMHTTAEIVDLKDIEATAQLLAAYIKEGL